MVTNASMEVGVINPKFFYQYGRELSLSRLKIHEWKTLLEKLQQSNLDIYTLFGPFDLLCKNYYTRRTYELPKLFADYDIPGSLYSEPTLFAVDSIDKFENFKLDWQEEVRIELTVENLKYLDAIQRDWTSVPNDVRERFIRSRVIFPNPLKKNSQHELKDIKAFVFIKLHVNTPTDLQIHRMMLQTRIFNQWMDSIVGLYWSTCDAQYHCAVEINVNDWHQLKQFVMDDCQSIKDIRDIRMETETNVAIYPVTNRQVPVSEVLRGAPLTPKTTPKLKLDEILVRKEGVEIEFKSTLRWDINANKPNNQMEKNVAKTIAAFMNTEGGTLVIGMADDRSIYGLEADIKTLGRKDIDGFETDLLRVIREYLGPNNAKYAPHLIEKRDNKFVCVVYVDGSPVPVSRPVNLTDMSVSTKPEEFWVRMGSSTIQLNLSERDKYIRDHWPDYKA